MYQKLRGEAEQAEILPETGNMLSDATAFCAWHEAVSLLSTGWDVATEPLVLNKLQL